MPFRSRPRSRGQAVVEFALIFPVFLLVLVMAVDFWRKVFFTGPTTTTPSGPGTFQNLGVQLIR